MILLLHIAIALASIGCATYALLRPSQKRLRINYGLMAGTIISGTYLVISTSVNILHTCLSGLLYVTSVSIMLTIVQHRLAHEHSSGN
jgi:hypothetical protein